MPPKLSRQNSAAVARRGAAAAAPAPNANGYKLPDPIPPGEILRSSNASQRWKLGKSIGVGGFGEIYLCTEIAANSNCRAASASFDDSAPLAVKIEPHENGPLFVEMNFYIRAAQPDSVEDFKAGKKISGTLGMPVYRGSGSHVFKGQRYRFLVMDRYGKDLASIFRDGAGKLFGSKAAFNLALQIIDVLEYIHSRGYVHNDIKAQNLLLGHGRTRENDVFLVDFGLVSKYTRNGVHLEYKPDARRAHDGTVEYASRDAHIGAHARRSDLEILAYNLVHWMSGNLPWMDNLKDPKYVQVQKNTFMKDIPAFLTQCFGDIAYPEELETFLTYVSQLEFDAQPDYARCKKIFSDGLKRKKLPLDGKVDFSAPKSPVKKARRVRGVRRRAAAASRGATPATSPRGTELLFGGEESGAVTRSNEAESMTGWCWESVLCSDPEMLIRQASRSSETDDESALAAQHRAAEERLQAESLQNPTPAMVALMERAEERERERQGMSWREQLQHITKKQQKAAGAPHNAASSSSWDTLTPSPLTPAMEEVIAMRQKRISVEIDTPITPEPSDTDDEEDDRNETVIELNGVGRRGTVGDREDEEEDSDGASSHEEYVPRSCKKSQQHLVANGTKRFMSPRTKVSGQPPDEDSCDGHATPTNSNGGGGRLDHSVLRLVSMTPSQLSEQREALKRFNRLKRERDRLRKELGIKNTPKQQQQGQPSESEDSDEQQPVAGCSKRRRISIQNDSAPAIRNKDSPPDAAASSKPVFVPLLPSKEKRLSPAFLPMLHPKRISVAARNRAVEKWVTNNNGSGGAEGGKSGSVGGNHAKPRRMSHIDDEKSLGFAAASSSANVTAPEVKVKAAPAPRVSRVASDAAGSSSGSIKGKAGGKHKPKGKSGLRSNAHGTRSSGLVASGLASSDKWKWNEVIFSNPERILRGGAK